jgi:O-succinylbenzoate synthase
LLVEIGAAIAAGCGTVSLRLSAGWGLEVVRAFRATFANHPLRVDFEGAAQRDLLFRLQDYQVEAIEQPLDADDLVSHAMLQESLRAPICLHESITSARRAEQALDMGACRQIRVSPCVCGGLREALEIAELCRQSGAECLVAAEAETEIGRRHAQALAASERFAASAETEIGGKAAPIKPSWSLWQESGIGIAPAEDLLKSVIARETF